MDEAQLSAEIRHLRAYNCLWAFLWVASTCIALNFSCPQVGRWATQPKCYKTSSGGLRISSWNGPLIVTHLVAGYSGRRIARLSPPIIFVDSESMEISREELAKLSWQCEGGPCKSPSKDAELGILYERPDVKMEKPAEP